MTDFEGSEMDQLQIMKNDNEHDPRAAISVKGAYKSFGWGPSGSGKKLHYFNVGGHQRRASLAVALLHEPDLLILDEPTVGVDPVLRRNIWGHLVDICNNPIRKTTIVVTTHYVDEARQANMVGMMRFGRILAQNCPSRLLKIYNKPTLEAVFFQLMLDEAIIDLVHYKEYKTAKDAVIAGKHWGVIHFLNGFSDAFRWRLGALFQKEDVDIKKINTSYIYIDLDTTNQQVMYSLKRSLYETFRSFSKELLTECYDIKNVEGYPAKYEKPIYGSINPTFTEFMAPGIILSIAFFMAVGLTAQSFILERNDGLLERAWVAGVTSAENMLAYMIAQFVVVIFQVTFAIVFLIYVFQIPSVGSLWLLGLLTTFQGVCGMSLGLLISALCNHEQDAIQVALGLFYPTLLLSGIVWPIEGMPSSLKYVSYIFPQTIACEAMRGILSRGWDPRWKVVFLGFVATTIWIFIFQILGALILRFKR
ncbi:unnamed protein product [Lepeophtheirus salmonis]|uniref:(salmon louse) hypothetical protein n=1 Tax=Lepeophtheirus salmonis TaxID=72036 RepID=A0A7R8CQ02_LEPSM|nr:unnamed protein product [Lepeophtheirus salmonis]CAF2853505.1 unnamed protein product [Lepeophtheirus salmonis]